MNPQITGLEKLLATGRDNDLLRFGLGNAYLQQGQTEQAITHLQAALIFNPNYSAAWKLLGKALTDTGQTEAARQAYLDGIAAAEKTGDKQALREMQVFAKRLSVK